MSRSATLAIIILLAVPLVVCAEHTGGTGKRSETTKKIGTPVILKAQLEEFYRTSYWAVLNGELEKTKDDPFAQTTLQVRMLDYDWSGVDFLAEAETFYSQKKQIGLGALPDFRLFVSNSEMLSFLEKRVPGPKAPAEFSVLNHMLTNIMLGLSKDKKLDPKDRKRAWAVLRPKWMAKTIESDTYSEGWGTALQMGACLGDPSALWKAKQLINSFTVLSPKKKEKSSSAVQDAVFALTSFETGDDAGLKKEIDSLLKSLEIHEDIPETIRKKITEHFADEASELEKYRRKLINN